MNIMKKKLNVVYLDVYDNNESSLSYTYYHNSKVDDEFSKIRFFITKDNWGSNIPSKNRVEFKDRLIKCDNYLNWKDELFKYNFKDSDLFLIVMGNIYLSKSNIESILCGYKDDRVILLADCSKEINYKSILLMNYNELINLDVNLKDIDNIKITPSNNIKQFWSKKDFNEIHNNFFKIHVLNHRFLGDNKRSNGKKKGVNRNESRGKESETDK